MNGYSQLSYIKGIKMHKKGERILVVGGTGFIGQHVVKHALNFGLDVTVIARSSDIIKNQEKIKVIHVDATDKESLMEKLGACSFEYVVNCAGYIDHTHFTKGGRNSFDNHFLLVLNLVEVLDKNTLKKFVNLGSSDEYGGSQAPQSELQREQPISPYALGKVASTHLLQVLHKTENFPSTVVRLFLAYGPGQNQQRFIPQVVVGCLNNITFPTSKGEQLRDFCYIDDVVDAIFLALFNDKASGEVFNIASGSPIAIRDVIVMIKDLVGGGNPEFGAIDYRCGENMALYADVSKAKSLLGWSPKISMHDGLAKTVQWMSSSKNQEDIYEHA